MTDTKHERLGVEEVIKRFPGWNGYGFPSAPQIVELIRDAEAALREEMLRLMGCGHPQVCLYEMGDWHPNIGGTDASESRCFACDVQAQAIEKALERERIVVRDELQKTLLGAELEQTEAVEAANLWKS